MTIKTLISSAEFEKMAPSLGPCELIDGEIVPMAPGGFEHSYSTGEIYLLIASFVKRHKLGWALTNETGINIRSELPRTRGADVAFISYKRIPRNKRPTGFLNVAPELIVEVIGENASWGGMEEKIADYHQTGVDMVWVADPHTRTVKLYPKGGMPTIVHDGSEIDGGEILPGFKVPIARFFDDE